MQAIQYIKSVPRYLIVRLLGKRWNWLYTSGASCIRLAEIDEHEDAYSGKQIGEVLEKGGFSAEKIKGGLFELGLNNWAFAQK